jgi:hypothetical protein
MQLAMKTRITFRRNMLKEQLCKALAKQMACKVSKLDGQPLTYGSI